MMIPVGMGYSALAAVPSNAALAPPTINVLNVTKVADFTTGGNWSPGDQYNVVISNVAQNVPVSLNGTVVGNTGEAGIYQYAGTVGQSPFAQTWSVPAGTYKSVGAIPALSQTINYEVGGGSASAPASGNAPAGTTSLCLFGDTSPHVSATIPVCELTAVGILGAIGVLFIVMRGSK